MSRPKGYKHTEKTKRKLSEANKGQIPWSKGKKLGPFSNEHRQKMSESAKLRIRNPLSEETKRKIGDTQRGKPRPTSRYPRSMEQRRKLSKAFKGRIITKEWREKLSKANMGKTGPNSSGWRGGISFEPYGVEFNNELKRQIRERDNHRCQLCWTNKDLVVHHIDYDKKNNYKKNLVLLCRRCHGRTGGNRKEYFPLLNLLINLQGEIY